MRGAPALEGKPSPAANEKGTPLTDLIRDALRSTDEGIVAYLFAKPGQMELRPRSPMWPVSRPGSWYSRPVPM